MDDIEIFACEIQSEIYKRQIKVLIEQILKIDETMQKSENQINSDKNLNEDKAAA